MATIFMYPLDDSASTAFIAAKFEEFGQVQAVRVFIAGLTPKFALVEMPCERSADRAVRAMNRKKVGRVLVDVAVLGVPT
jgi:hypothetical protein